MLMLLLSFQQTATLNITEIFPRKYSKCGGVGVRYTCQIGRSQTYLYYEVGKWFVEAKESIPEEPA